MPNGVRVRGGGGEGRRRHGAHVEEDRLQWMGNWEQGMFIFWNKRQLLPKNRNALKTWKTLNFTSRSRMLLATRPKWADSKATFSASWSAGPATRSQKAGRVTDASSWRNRPSSSTPPFYGSPNNRSQSRRQGGTEVLRLMTGELQAFQVWQNKLQPLKWFFLCFMVFGI